MPSSNQRWERMLEKPYAMRTINANGLNLVEPAYYRD